MVWKQEKRKEENKKRVSKKELLRPLYYLNGSRKRLLGKNYSQKKKSGTEKDLWQRSIGGLGHLVPKFLGDSFEAQLGEGSPTFPLLWPELNID